jgi:outer membrane protein assembly factor BamB
MSLKANRWMLAASLALLNASLATAEDWPQWRGPARNGISAEAGLLQQWPAEGPKLVWQVNDAGGGYSTPSIVGDRLYVMGNEGTDNEFVQARKVADGQIIWTTKVGGVGPNEGPQYPGARGTPTVDGEHLYAIGSDGDLVCLKTDSGDVVWRKQFRTDFGGVPGKWAYSESPLVDGDTLVCTPGGSEATVIALNKLTGELIWKCATAEADQAAYASAIVLESPLAGKQYVQFLEKGLVGLDAATGALLWRYTGTAEGSAANIPTPIASDDHVYSAAGRTGGGLVKLAKTADGLTAEQVYFSAGLPTSIGGSVKVGDYLYGTNGQGLMCVDFLSGEVKWQERGIGASSVCFADGRIYQHGESGEAALIEPSPEGYREVGRFTPPNQPDRGRAKAWAYPVVSNGKLYLRDATSIWCFDISQ